MTPFYGYFMNILIINKKITNHKVAPDTDYRDYEMKSLMKIALVFTLFAGMFFMASCEEEAKVNVDLSSEVVGKAIATPSTIKNGEEIVLSIGGVISASDKTTINGKEYYPIIHYLIDGNEVAKSAETTLPFSAKYTVHNLSVGEHVISVDITSSREEAFFENNVSSSTITVLE